MPNFFQDLASDAKTEDLVQTGLPRAVMSVRDAELTYGQTQALRGISLELHAGEILGLLGPNGAGKTSLIRCIAGRCQLDNGSIDFAMEGNRQHLVGVVPQELAIYPDLTVVQNLKAFARFLGLGRSDILRAVNEALAWADLEHKSRALVRTLSGGMQRRLNIACSVLHGPKILLLDEPTVGVDPQSRERIYEMLERLLQDGTSIMLTTHHLEEAQDRCDRIAIIDQGSLIDCGTFDELVDRSIGSGQHVCIRFRNRPRSVPAPLRLEPAGQDARAELQDVTRELPQLLNAISAQNLSIEHVDLSGPTLQHMFLHLTGKELRE